MMKIAISDSSYSAQPRKKKASSVMGNCFSIAHAQRISVPCPPAATRNESIEKESKELPTLIEERETVKEVVVLSEITTCLSAETLPQQTVHSQDRQNRHSFLQKIKDDQQIKTAVDLHILEPYRLISAAAADPASYHSGVQIQRNMSERSPVIKPRPSRTHSFSGDLSAICSRVTALSPNRTQPDPSPSRRHSGSFKMVHSKDQKPDPGESAVRGNDNRRSISERSPSMRRMSQLSPSRTRTDHKGKSKRLDEGYTKELKAKKQNAGDMLESPSISLECFIFL